MNHTLLSPVRQEIDKRMRTLSCARPRKAPEASEAAGLDGDTQLLWMLCFVLRSLKRWFPR